MTSNREHSSKPSRFAPHAMLLAVAMLEFMELELFEIGAIHHLWDLFVVASYAYVAARVGGARRHGGVVLALGAIPWTMDIANLQSRPVDWEAGFWALEHAYLASLVFRHLFAVRDVRLAELNYAVSLYIIAALSFANVYALILSENPDALRYVLEPEGTTVSYDLVIYYSFVTQATVGFGDMAPVTPSARFISVLQALFGVIYVAVLISRFVAIHSSRFVATATQAGVDE